MALATEVSKRIVPGTQSNASMVIFLDWMKLALKKPPRHWRSRCSQPKAEVATIASREAELAEANIGSLP
jgi:hypothetical protein